MGDSITIARARLRCILERAALPPKRVGRVMGVPSTTLIEPISEEYQRDGGRRADPDREQTK